MAQLIHADPEQRPFAKVVQRIIAERKGYSFFTEGRYAEAIECYRNAITHTREGSRGRLKTGAGVALSSFMASNHDELHRSRLHTELTAVATEARSSEFPDVLAWATANLKKQDEGATDGWIAFEIP